MHGNVEPRVFASHNDETVEGAHRAGDFVPYGPIKLGTF